ncbi:MAG: nucleotidyltransferase [Herpetosiphonaceae bacterium]|nr:MAG: nucleotidyltransferase [Herpetosiphonaceae bacterium]
MIAVLLVGGLGTRLRPLTDSCPKPLVPIANVPFMTRRLRQLARQQIGEAILAVQYLAGRFREVYEPDTDVGLRVRIVEEPQPLGTAGAARHALERRSLPPGQPVMIFNGDLLTDLDLNQMLAFHQHMGAVATIAVAEVEDPRACGVVVADDAGRVSAFQEKPAPGSELARTVNTGVYIIDPTVLEYVPSMRFTTFERELFPELLARGLPVAAFRHSALWIDIGTVEGYLAANAAVLEGRVQGEPLPGEQIAPGIWAEALVHIDPAASLSAPIVLGRGAVVEAGARLIGPLAIGAGSRIGAGATVEQAILWERVNVGADAVISASALADGVAVPPGAKMTAVALG